MEKIVNAKNVILAVLAAVGSAIAPCFGGWDALLKLLVGMMCLDYLTGLLVAGIWNKSNKSESGAISSKASFKGLLRKGVILLIVALGAGLDCAFGIDYIRTAIIVFMMGNEGISLIENIGAMGIPAPDFLKKAFEMLREKGNEGGKDGK